MNSDYPLKHKSIGEIHMVKKIVIKLLPNSMKSYLVRMKILSKYKKILKQSNDTEKKIFLLSVPNHGNLGDQAIIKAQKKYLEDKFPQYQVICIYTFELRLGVKYFKEIINNHIICIPGGGFLGTLWKSEDDIVNEIISNFSENKIIIFPQSIYYDNNEDGEKVLRDNQAVYGAHKALYICTRDSNSYAFTNQHFKNNTILKTPDIVLYLQEARKGIERKGALFCIRKDKESILSNDIQKEKVIECMKEKFGTVMFTDTVINMEVKEEDREEQLQIKWDEFRKSEVVITDRLHGMIFAAITETPCVALNNISKKVEGVYEWIKELEYITFVNDINEVETAVEKVIKSKNRSYYPEMLQKEFEKIEACIKE